MRVYVLWYNYLEEVLVEDIHVLWYNYLRGSGLGFKKCIVVNLLSGSTLDELIFPRV